MIVRKQIYFINLQNFKAIFLQKINYILDLCSFSVYFENQHVLLIHFCLNKCQCQAIYQTKSLPPCQMFCVSCISKLEIWWGGERKSH